MTLSVQHAFVQVPENDFQPRRDDLRVGYFGQQFDDLTSDQTVYCRYANDRFVLIKDSASKLKDKLLVDGRSHNDLVVGTKILFGEFRSKESLRHHYPSHGD